MPTYIYRVRRKSADAPVFNAPGRPTLNPEAVADQETVVPDALQLSYRELQALAKERDIPANQSRADLEAAIENSNG